MTSRDRRLYGWCIAALVANMTIIVTGAVVICFGLYFLGVIRLDFFRGIRSGACTRQGWREYHRYNQYLPLLVLSKIQEISRARVRDAV